MIYTLVDKKVLFAYDGDSGLTMKFDGEEWQISEIDYNALMLENGVEIINEEKAMKLVGKKNPSNLINSLSFSENE